MPRPILLVPKSDSSSHTYTPVDGPSAQQADGPVEWAYDTEGPGLPQHSSHVLELNQNPFTQTAKPPKAETQSDTPLIGIIRPPNTQTQSGPTHIISHRPHYLDR